jgi:hypothetical protein
MKKLFLSVALSITTTVFASAGVFAVDLANPGFAADYNYAVYEVDRTTSPSTIIAAADEVATVNIKIAQGSADIGAGSSGFRTMLAYSSPGLGKTMKTVTVNSCDNCHLWRPSLE